MNQKKVELLAPAGNMEALHAAVIGGCDAVYLGLQSFSARAFAGNFSHEEIQEAVRYAHIHDVKVYVTINTMLYETEMEKAKQEVDFLYNNDIDALLIQDPGLFSYVRMVYPDFDIHCSTQMHIHNMAGVKFMTSLGAKRVVLARETPIELIRAACRTGTEIEVFCYGAVCISYSGQCLMSAAVKNRSANRGMCAQCCRLKYFDENGKPFKEGEYILSPKDLNLVDRVPQLIEAGVASLKIEGRMKRPEYVYLAVRTFREAIDAYYEGRSYHPDAERQRDLLLMFNRGFSHGHAFHDDVVQRMSQKRPNHQGIEIGKVLDFHHGDVTVKLSAPLYQHDGLRIINEPHDTGLTAVKIEKKGKLVNSAQAGDIVTLPCHSAPAPERGQSLRKTSDARLLASVDEEIGEERRVPVSLIYEGTIDQPFKITVTDPSGRTVSASSSITCQAALKAPLSREKIEAALKKCGDTAYEAVHIEGKAEGIFLPVAALNETRREALAQLDELRAIRHMRKGRQPETSDLSVPESIPYKLFVQGYDGFKKDDVFIMDDKNTRPVADERYEGEDSSYVILSSLNDLAGRHTHCIAGMTMNIANSYAIAFMLAHGCDGVMLSSEMDDVQICNCLEAFEKRYHFKPFVIQLVYGKRTVMYIKDRFCSERPAYLTDVHGLSYDLEYRKDITMIKEPEHVRRCNRYCAASLVLLSDEKNKKEILEEAYEEISERV